MPLLVKVLQTDREDVEITNLALEGLLGMMRTQLQVGLTLHACSFRRTQIHVPVPNLHYLPAFFSPNTAIWASSQ